MNKRKHSSLVDEKKVVTSDDQMVVPSKSDSKESKEFETESKEFETEMKLHPDRFRHPMTIMYAMGIPVPVAAIICRYGISLLEFKWIRTGEDEHSEYDVFSSTLPINMIHDGPWLLAFKALSVSICGFKEDEDEYTSYIECDPAVPRVCVWRPNHFDYQIVVPGRPNEVKMKFNKHDDFILVDVDNTLGKFTTFSDVINQYIQIEVRRTICSGDKILPDDIVSYTDDSSNVNCVISDMKRQRNAEIGNKIAVLSVRDGYIPGIVKEYPGLYPSVEITRNNHTFEAIPARWAFFGCFAI